MNSIGASTAGYAVNDGVEYRGSSYVAVQAGTANPPDVSPAFWGLLAQQGGGGSQTSAGLVWRGAWNIALAYAVDDGVEYNGSSYISIQAGTSKQPDVSPAYWSLLAEQGAAGEPGAAGPQGPAGPAGTTGPQGPPGAQGSAGPASLTWQGTWNIAAAYAANDAVEYNGSSYISVQASTGRQPDKSPAYWNVLAQNGVGLTWQGLWSNTTAYAVSDAVEYNGSSYIAIQAGTGKQPDMSPAYWSVLAQQGIAGATGPQGPTGASGATGPQGSMGAAGAQGPAGLTWQGVWTNTTAYAVSDAVEYNGSSYIGVQAGTGKQPDMSPAYWSLLAQEGTAGASGPQGQTGLTGAAGPQGPAGATGATGAQGPAGLTWQGIWSNTTAYTVSDAVEYNGSSYISVQAGTGKQPDISPADWSLLARQGTAGASGPQGQTGLTGAAGPQGPAGATGATGAQGPAGLTWQGVWINTTAYTVSDAVEYNGSSYISVQAGTGKQPDISPADWSLLARQGTAGASGPQGQTGLTGAAGPQGPAGATGATGAQGPAGLTWQGIWSNTTAYTVSDAVEYNGSSYISIQAGTAKQPDVNPTYWTLLAAGIQSYTAASHQWISAVASDGTPSSSQPAFTDISGSVAASQLPNPSPTNLGGVLSRTVVSHQWINSIGTNGRPVTSQPADSDLSVSNNTTNDVSTGSHGFAPKAPSSTVQWLRGDATWANAPGRLASFTVITTTGASTYTTPANITAILVECVAGGGGGGGAAGVTSQAAAGGSGGSGSYSRKYISSPAASYSVSVGTGGNGGVPGNNAGSSGSNTTFGSTIVTCNGGSGASGGASGTTALIALGGAGGAVSTGGDINTGGQAGGNGLRLSSAISASSPGGASNFGGGAAGVLNAAGTAAVNYGAGGSGGSTQGATNRAGGNGSQGVIVVWQFQ